MSLKYLYHKFPYMILPIISLLFTGTAIEILPFPESSTTIAILSQTFFLLMAGIIIRRLYNQAHTDPLTRLGNRRYFQNQFKFEFERAKQTKIPFCLALIDVDNFKAINDNYGHLIGDKVLCRLSRTCQSNTRKYDIIARLGGDEFAIIFPNTEIDEARKAAEKIRREVENKHSNLQVTLSIGLTSVEHSQSLDANLDMADKALYDAKQTKNTVSISAGQSISKHCNKVLAS